MAIHATLEIMNIGNTSNRHSNECLRTEVVKSLRHGCEAAVRPPRGARREGQGKVGEADGSAERALMLGLGRDTM